jgi:hypothetical protein
MDKIEIVHDAEGQVLKVWLDDPTKKAMCEETIDRGYGYVLVAPPPLWPMNRNPSAGKSGSYLAKGVRNHFTVPFYAPNSW